MGVEEAEAANTLAVVATKEIKVISSKGTTRAVWRILRAPRKCKSFSIALLKITKVSNLAPVWRRNSAIAESLTGWNRKPEDGSDDSGQHFHIIHQLFARCNFDDETLAS